ncbi:MAG: BTAD domain-containing putative transcriptional regulator, partial [Candidatus Bipolaricaulota bacterium]
DAVVATRHMIGLRRDNLWIDVAAFRAGLSPCRTHDHAPNELCEPGAATLREAVEVVSSGFLAGFVVDDSRAFEEWQFAEADALNQELTSALQLLGEHAERIGDLEQALAFAQRQLAVDPLHEPTVRRVMTLSVECGDRSTALKAFDACSAAFERDLAISPSEETVALAETIRTRAPLARRQPARGRPLPPLPSPRTPLVGRQDEVREICDLLSQQECRLLTVTGTGGSGKTRLAIEAARRSADAFPDGVVFVSFAATDAPALAPAAVAEALGEAHGREAEDLGARLDRREILLVLDNLEHLLRDLRWLERLLAETTGPRFLATSRQELDVEDEWLFPLRGLDVPGEGLSPAEVAQCGAVQLFLQAARRANARFAPTERDLEATASIARALQGNPLALELAGAWVRSSTCGDIAEQISRSLDFLRSEQAWLPRRHRSLRAAFEGSWSLLDRDGRRTFRALSVFRGGFTPEAAALVANAPRASLASLVARSLLQREADGRYQMLEVVRQYAAERLHAMPDDETKVLDAHADYFLALLAGQEPRLKCAEQRDAVLILSAEIPNLTAAWLRACASRPCSELSSAAMGLFLFFDMTSRMTEGAELFSRAVDAAAVEPDLACRSVLRGFHAWFTAFLDPKRGAELFRESLALAAPLSLDRGLAFIRVLAAYSRGRCPLTETPDLREALSWFERAGLVWEAGAACDALAAGRPAEPESLELAARGIALKESIGDHWGVALGRHSKAVILAAKGDRAAARAEIQASAELRKHLGLDPQGQMNCQAYLGRLALDADEPAVAVGHFEQALAIAQRLRAPADEASAQACLARCRRALGDHADAERLARAAIAQYEALHRVDEALAARRWLEEVHSTSSEPAPKKAARRPAPRNRQAKEDPK